MKENVFGIPMDVTSREEALEAAQGDDPVYYGVMRCRDLPSARIPAPIRARNIVERCTGCGEPCWVDTKNYLPNTIIRCLACLPAELRLNAIDETVSEVRGYYR